MRMDRDENDALDADQSASPKEEKGQAIKAIGVDVARGAVTGGWAGAAKVATSGVLKTKAGRRFLAGALALLLALPLAAAMLPGMLIILATGAGKSSQTGMVNVAVRSDGMTAQQISGFESSAGSKGAPWEILAAIANIQQGKGSGPFGIDTSKTELDTAAAADPRATGDYLAGRLYESSKSTVGNLANPSLDAGSVAAPGTNGLIQQRINNDDPAQKSQAAAVEKAYTAAIATLPLAGNPEVAERIFEKARQYKLGQTGQSSCVALPVAGTGKWVNPLKGTLTSGFGGRLLPNGDSRSHEGADVAGPGRGTPYFSASDGTVVAAFGNSTGEGTGDGGNGIVVDIGGGINIWYWHAEPGTTKVKRGDKVTAGQQLAGIGDSGYTFGVHLHMQVMENGKAIDPVAYLKARGVELGSGPAPASGATTAGNTSSSAQASGQTNWENAGAFTATTTSGMAMSLGKNQLANAAAIIGVGESMGLSEDKIVVALMTALQESTLWMYANTGNPESMTLAYDKLGRDQDSVGLFQQRPSTGWGATKDLMNAEYSARAFFGGPGGPNKGEPPGLLDFPGIETKSLNDQAQTVQRSGVPDAYAKWEPVARQIVATVKGTSTPSGCSTSSNSSAITDAKTASAAEVKGYRKAIIAAAEKGLGGDYVPGGTDFRRWDSSGYVQWAYKQAGIDLPRTSQWGSGTPTSTPKSGDLVVVLADGFDASGKAISWSQVGIYAGKKDGKEMFYNALNPTQKTVLVEISAVGTDAQFFQLVPQVAS